MNAKALLHHILLAGVPGVSSTAMAGTAAQYDQGTVGPGLASEWVTPEAHKQCGGTMRIPAR